MLEGLKRLVRSSPALERAARGLLDKRYQLARKYLRGVGLEIGALDRPLYLPKGVKTYYVDRLAPSGLYEHYPELLHRKFFVSVVGHGEELMFIRDGALDFVIANHVIEHCQDPIGTLKNFARCLRPGGVVYLAVPDKRRTFDVRRGETTVEHLLRDHREGPAGSRDEHYREWAEFVEERTGDDAARRARELMQTDYSIHFHCWTRDSFRDFLDSIESESGLRNADVMSWRNENIFILTNR